MGRTKQGKAKRERERARPQRRSMARCEMHLIDRLEPSRMGYKAPLAVLPEALALGWRMVMHGDARGRYRWVWACCDCAERALPSPPAEFRTPGLVVFD